MCAVTGGHCIDVIMRLLGIPLDPEKSFDFIGQLILLGVLICPDPVSQTVLICVDEDKARRWAEDLRACLRRGACDSAMAGKLAGRLSFACCVAADRVGRAYLPPLHAQQDAHRWRVHISECLAKQLPKENS